MIKKHHVYKLDNEFLKCTNIYEGGIYAFQVCDKEGNIREPVKKDGTTVEWGTRLVKKRINELIEI